MDFLNKLVLNHAWSSLVASHAFVVLLSNLDRLIKIALTYFSAKQIDSVIDAAAGAAKSRVDLDSQDQKS